MSYVTLVFVFALFTTLYIMRRRSRLGRRTATF